MTGDRKVTQMSRVTDALYLKEFQKIRHILERENELRASLTRLSEQVAQAQTQQTEAFAMQTIGADLLWQGWVTRTRRQLNIELAQVLAQKMRAISEAQRAFGKQQAVKSMRDMAAAARREKIDKHLQGRLAQSWEIDAGT